MKVHFGERIEIELKKQGRRVPWLADKLHCDRSNIYKIFKNPDISAQQLFSICAILGYQFLLDILDDIKKERLAT
jgi:hypothetical protein